MLLARSRCRIFAPLAAAAFFAPLAAATIFKFCVHGIHPLLDRDSLDISLLPPAFPHFISTYLIVDAGAFFVWLRWLFVVGSGCCARSADFQLRSSLFVALTVTGFYFFLASFPQLTDDEKEEVSPLHFNDPRGFQYTRHHVHLKSLHGTWDPDGVGPGWLFYPQYAVMGVPCHRGPGSHAIWDHLK